MLSRMPALYPLLKLELLPPPHLSVLKSPLAPRLHPQLPRRCRKARRLPPAVHRLLSAVLPVAPAAPLAAPVRVLLPLPALALPLLLPLQLTALQVWSALPLSCCCKRMDPRRF